MNEIIDNQVGIVEDEPPIVVGRFISDPNEEWDAACEGEWPSDNQ